MVRLCNSGVLEGFKARPVLLAGAAPRVNSHSCTNRSEGAAEDQIRALQSSSRTGFGFCNRDKAEAGMCSLLALPPCADDESTLHHSKYHLSDPAR